MANRLFELPQTKGYFELQGVVSGVTKDNFYKDVQRDSGRDYRIVNFGVLVDNGKMVYINLLGMVQDKVFFSKKTDKGWDRKEVDWNKRHTFAPEGYRLNGMNLGLTKGDDGKNNIKYFVQYDACKYISENLQDGMSVFIRGNLDFGHYTNNNGNVVYTQKLVPSQISLLGNNLDFDADDFEPHIGFSQFLIFDSIIKDEETGNGIVNAYVVNYNSVENVKFEIHSPSLAKQFKKNLKPYHAMKVNGTVTFIPNADVVEEEEETEHWGEEDTTKRVFVPYRRVFLITGADPFTTEINQELYTEETVTEAIELTQQEDEAVTNFGDDEEDEHWGDEGEEVKEETEEAW